MSLQASVDHEPTGLCWHHEPLRSCRPWPCRLNVDNEPTQCCSCLFVSGRTVVYRSYYKRPQFSPKIDFGGPNYRLQRLMLRLMWTGPAGLCWRLDRPGRTPSTCVAWQLQHCVGLISWGNFVPRTLCVWWITTQNSGSRPRSKTQYSEVLIPEFYNLIRRLL